MNVGTVGTVGADKGLQGGAPFSSEGVQELERVAAAGKVVEQELRCESFDRGCMRAVQNEGCARQRYTFGSAKGGGQRQSQGEPVAAQQRLQGQAECVRARGHCRRALRRLSPKQRRTSATAFATLCVLNAFVLMPPSTASTLFKAVTAVLLTSAAISGVAGLIIRCKSALVAVAVTLDTSCWPGECAGCLKS